MTSKLVRVAVLVAVVLGGSVNVSSQSVAVPNPILVFIGQEYYAVNGSNLVRYRYNVFNFDAYPAAMFASAPALPPCGANTNASRTWVDVYDQRGRRLFGFCALGSGAGLNTIWFALPEGEVPPSWVYIEMNDRATGLKYKSNLAETTL